MSLRVLVAEDEAIIRLDLTETLTAEGYTVVGDCGRGDRAVELAAELDPDIVMLDIKMPGLDGISAARRISESTDAAIVMLTAFGQRRMIAEAGGAGAMALLTKPYRRSDLVAALELAAARRSETTALAAKSAGLVAEVEGLKDRFEQRKLVDRAKGALMDDHGLTESEAHRLLQRSAMSRRLRMADVADEVLGGKDPANGAEPGDGAQGNGPQSDGDEPHHEICPDAAGRTREIGFAARSTQAVGKQG